MRRRTGILNPARERKGHEDNSEEAANSIDSETEGLENEVDEEGFLNLSNDRSVPSEHKDAMEDVS